MNNGIRNAFVLTWTKRFNLWRGERFKGTRKCARSYTPLLLPS